MIDSEKTYRILILEDSEFDAELEVRELRKSELPFVWSRVQTKSEFEQALRNYRPDIVLVDYKLPDFDGEQAVVMVKTMCPDVPAVVVTGAVGEDTAVGLFQKGAVDFVLKDRISGRLGPVVKRALGESANLLANRLVNEQREQLNSEMHRLATHDPLTGVASRPLLLEKLMEVLPHSKPQSPEVAFFSIDLNHFKQINATYGVQFADQILLETARRLTSLCEGQDLVANLGGDRFFLLIRRVGLEREMPVILENIQKCFTRSFDLRGLSILIDASIGGVVLRNPSDTTADILSQSEEAMRKAKLGKVAGIALVDEGMIKELKSRSSLDKEIQEAVRTKNLFLLFQPIVFLETGKIVGAEGLMRFRRKDGSILNAAEFMDALIRTGSLSLIDEMVIADFLDSEQIVIRSILKKGDFRFSFNISPGILANVGYAEGILKQIQKRNFSPDRFTLEILEEGLMPTNGTVRQNLIKLQEAGVRISVDDFGIGYSNLVRLSRLPLGELKIPRELLAGIKSGDQRLRSLLDAVLGIAKNLNLSVIAEGVEEQDEVAYLRKLGCKYGQGYLFGKGMPLEELAARVEKQA